MADLQLMQNRPINEEFDFWGAPRRDLISKIRKSLIKNGGPNPHPKFQHSSLIRKYLKIRGKDSIFGGPYNPPQRRKADPIYKN